MNSRTRFLIILAIGLVASLVLLIGFRKSPEAGSRAMITKPAAITYTGGEKRDYLHESLTRLVRKDGPLLDETEMATPLRQLNPDLSILDLQEWLLSAEHQMKVVVYESDLQRATGEVRASDWHQNVTPGQLTDAILAKGEGGIGKSSGPSARTFEGAEKR